MDAVHPWPSEFPEGCPPPDCVDPVGTALYRFGTCGSRVMSEDLRSHAARNPVKWGYECRFHGLSVYSNINGLKAAWKQNPKLASKRWKSVIELRPPVGCSEWAHTPSRGNAAHATLWLRNGSEQSVLQSATLVVDGIARVESAS